MDDTVSYTAVVSSIVVACLYIAMSLECHMIGPNGRINETECTEQSRLSPALSHPHLCFPNIEA